MNLVYRGIAYNSNSDTVNTSATGIRASFRGKDYLVRSSVRVPAQSSFELVYRGITYSK